MTLSQILSSIARRRHVPVKGWKVLSGKEFPKFNKGNRAMKAGFLDKWANFHVVKSMLPEYRLPPNLHDCKLTPYVAREERQALGR